MEEGTNFIWSTIFQHNDPSERKPIESINVYIIDVCKEKADGVAFMWGENNLNFSNVMIEKYDYQGPEKWDLKKEYTAVMYHEITHILQWGGGGKAPLDYKKESRITQRLKQLMQPDFVKPGEGA
uniref:uncharacterized protein LOC122601444 n=1 Tax=Erigeron canadensis TaxID=72917 RepID=UPI001CB89D0E|nr:uncharacterized protein LOC122601444 [Erigeron canadensis]